MALASLLADYLYLVHQIDFIKLLLDHMTKILLPFILLICLASPLFGQVGGDNTYEFLNLNASARVASLGGSLISVRDDDASLAYHNPALLNSSMHRQLAFSHAFHLAGINYGYASYSLPAFFYAVLYDYLGEATFMNCWRTYIRPIY